MLHFTVNLDDDEVRRLFKQAILEMLEEKNELVYEAMAEVLEDVALADAIQEGEHTDPISRDEIFRLLEGLGEG